MQDLELPFLSPRIVAGLTGLSLSMLRRWQAQGIPNGTRRRGPNGAGRRRNGGSPLYSWSDVEQLQRATHLLKTRRLSLAEVKRLLKQSAAKSAGPARRDWVIARPKPRGMR
ncbi:MAG TPA: MerR family transcriptional regulator [bacterium]|nr:MerR family transcriptional regulator [bacterium]